MSRKFIATIVATAVAVTGISAAPARADQDDIAKLLFGAAAIFMISKAIKDDDSHVSSKSNHHSHNTVKPHNRHNTVKPRPLPRRAKRTAPIPARCLKRHETRDGVVRMIGKRCVNRHYRDADRLPTSCKISRHTYDGMRHGYKPRCLRRSGFQLAQY